MSDYTKFDYEFNETELTNNGNPIKCIKIIKKDSQGFKTSIFLTREDVEKMHEIMENK